MSALNYQQLLQQNQILEAENPRDAYNRNKSREQQRANWFGSAETPQQIDSARAVREQEQERLRQIYNVGPRQKYGPAATTQPPFGTNYDFQPSSNVNDEYGQSQSILSNYHESSASEFRKQETLQDSRGYELTQKLNNRQNPVFRNAPFATDSNDNLKKYSRQEVREERQHAPSNRPRHNGDWETEQSRFANHGEHLADNGQDNQHRRKKVLNREENTGKKFNLITGEEIN